MTAAHCFLEPYVKRHIKIVIAPSDAYSEGNEQSIDVETVDKHPNYDYEKSAYFDIGGISLPFLKNFQYILKTVIVEIEKKT